MYILGINAYHADSSAAIFKDGVMIAATEEERFTRIKHWAGFPVLAIKFCLQEAGITLGQLDYISIGRDPKAKFLNKLHYLRKNPSLVFGAIKRYHNSREVTSLEKEFSKIDGTVSFNAIKNKIKNIEHHRSHLASAFFASPFEESAILSIDGSGDFTTTMIAVGKGNKIEVLDSIDFPVSCGLFYTAFTQFLGFPHYGDEYKVMGLAPYGEAKYIDKVKKVLKFLPNGLYSWHDDYFIQPTKAGFKYENNIPSVGNLYSAKFVKGARCGYLDGFCPVFIQPCTGTAKGCAHLYRLYRK
jgi:carbamoyltransferase